MNEKIKTFQEECNKTAGDCQKFCFMSRAKEFQLEAYEKLSKLKERTSALKKQMVEMKDEDSANVLLSFEAMIDALTSELKMWIALKDDNPNSAWGFLINAQDAARTAMLAHKVASHLEGYVKRLCALEKILFPPQVFLSTGMIIQNSKCSICGREYGECEHVVGRPYMGEMCGRIITDIKELKEVSLVHEPADKRCRILGISDEGVTRDFLTWRIASDPPLKDK